MSKVIITRLANSLISAILEEGKVIEIQKMEEAREDAVGNIFIGKIKNIVKNINAAFIDMGNGRIGYLSLERIESWVFTRQARKNQVTIGDEIVLQIEKAAVKTKAPVLNGEFNLTGKYAVLVHGMEEISCSRKIKDKQWIREITERLKAKLPTSCGVIIRTNAYQEEQALELEIETLLAIHQEIKEKSIYRTCFTVLYRMPPAYIHQILSLPKASNQIQVVTDERKVFDSLKELEEINLSFYEDKLLPLVKLHSLETVLERALKSQVWLKSGGYLVIEPTEALTVIDVNTGKNVASHTDKEETFYKTNREAAKEIAIQLRLRNISGIIIIDFIDMNQTLNKKNLLDYLEECIESDQVKTTLVDMTKLNLVELTRKRVKKPLDEQFGLSEGKIFAR